MTLPFSLNDIPTLHKIHIMPGSLSLNWPSVFSIDPLWTTDGQMASRWQGGNTSIRREILQTNTAESCNCFKFWYQAGRCAAIEKKKTCIGSTQICQTRMKKTFCFEFTVTNSRSLNYIWHFLSLNIQP